MRRLALLLLLVLAPAAEAQAPPPDERAAARAFGEAAVRFSEAANDVDDDDPTAEALESRACRRVLRGLPESRSPGAGRIVFSSAARSVAGAVNPILSRFRSELANVATADPALISGRAAWRRSGRTLVSLPPAGDLCARLRTWIRAGYPRATVRAANRERVTLLRSSSRGIQRKTAAAARRMLELGASREGAEAFEGDA